MVGGRPDRRGGPVSPPGGRSVDLVKILHVEQRVGRPAKGVAPSLDQLFRAGRGGRRRGGRQPVGHGGQVGQTPASWSERPKGVRGSGPAPWPLAVRGLGENSTRGRPAGRPGWCPRPVVQGGRGGRDWDRPAPRGPWTCENFTSRDRPGRDGGWSTSWSGWCRGQTGPATLS